MRRGLKMIGGVIAAVVLVGCAAGPQPKPTVSENWIDIDDVISLVAQNDFSYVAMEHQLGKPVTMELKADTLMFVYEFRSRLYKVPDNQTEAKPTEKEFAGKWNCRFGRIGLLIHGGKLVGIENIGGVKDFAPGITPVK